VIGVVPVRSGIPAGGAVDVLSETAGRAVLVGSGTQEAVGFLAGGVAGEVAGRFPLPLAAGGAVTCLELGGFEPARWADELAPLLAGEGAVILPASPDGRDLAPRLARRLGRELLAGALRVRPGGATLSRAGGLQDVEVVIENPFVATLVPVHRLLPTARATPIPHESGGQADSTDGTEAVRILEVLEPDPAAMDLAEASRIMAGGGGLGGDEEFSLLQEVAAVLGASVGATRVVTDAGLMPHDRQIGTTGVSVGPQLYVALGISGATQHIGGIGEPEHVISVNTDPSCPMMLMADLALVSDAAATLRALAGRLGVTS
jgi:electron transfer flavoprotein alpha subunit